MSSTPVAALAGRPPANPGLPGWTRRKSERNQAIVELCRTHTQVWVAARFGITRERVRQILAAEAKRQAKSAT